MNRFNNPWLVIGIVAGIFAGFIGFSSVRDVPTNLINHDVLNTQIKAMQTRAAVVNSRADDTKLAIKWDALLGISKKYGLRVERQVPSSSFKPEVLMEFATTNKNRYYARIDGDKRRLLGALYELNKSTDFIVHDFMIAEDTSIFIISLTGV